MRGLVGALTVALVVSITSPLGHAHAYVDSSSPADSATLAAPREVIVRFT